MTARVRGAGGEMLSASGPVAVPEGGSGNVVIFIDHGPVAPAQAVTSLSGSGTLTSKYPAEVSGLISSFTIDVARGTFHGTGSAKGKPYVEPPVPFLGVGKQSEPPPRPPTTYTETVTLDGRYQGDGNTGTLEGTWTRKQTSPREYNDPINYSSPFRGKLENGTVTGGITGFTLNVQVK